MYQVIILPYFRRQIKPLVKRYRHFKDDVISVLENFDKSNCVSLGANVYKMRFKVTDIPKGKSKSFRMIVLLVEVEKFVVPVCVYFKGDRQDISKKEINRHLEVSLLELRLEKLVY